MSDRESREQEAREIRQEAAEAGVPPLHYMLGNGVLSASEPCPEGCDIAQPHWHDEHIVSIGVATSRQTDGALRCGLCWRDVFGTSHGERWHKVYADGSMRCSAPEALAVINDITPSWVRTFIVHATPERMELLARALGHLQERRDVADSQMDAMRLSHE